MRADEGAGDVDAVYRAEAPGLRRLAFLLLGDAAEAEEVVHEVFVAALPHWHRLDGPGGYLRRSVANRCTSRRRRAARLAAMPVPRERVVEAGSPEEASVLWAALGALPVDQRAVVVLRYWLDLDDAAIGGLLGCRPGTVRTRLHRALAKLRGVVDP